MPGPPKRRSRAAGRPWSAWLVAGFLYMTLAMGALIVLRAREPEGVLLILWLVLIVVAADVGAYFVGRSVGGQTQGSGPAQAPRSVRPRPRS